MKNKALLTFLAAIMILTLSGLSGCERSEPIVKDGLTGVFSETAIPLPDGYGVFEAPVCSDGVFTVDLFLIDEDGNYYVDRDRKALTFDKSGEVLGIEPGKPFSASGSFELGKAVFTSDERFNLTFTYKDDEIAVINLPRLFGHDDSEFDNQRYDAASFGLISIAEDSGVYYLLTTDGICAVSQSGDVLWTKTYGCETAALLSTDIGIFCLAGESSPGGSSADKTYSLRRLMPDGSLGDASALPDCIAGADGIGGRGVSFYRGSSDQKLYAATETALWSLSMEVNKKNGSVSCSASECLNWLNSDISPSSIAALCVADENTAAAVRSTNGRNQLVLLTRTPESELSQKKIIRLALMSEPYEFAPYIQSAIERFNRENGDYRITVTDFTIYESERRSMLFNAELSAGRVPDILILSSESENDPTVRDYADSGIFCDLLELMKASGGFDYENLLGYATKPYLQGGRQYVFPLRPSAETQFGSSEYFSGPMTPEEVFSEIERLPDGVHWTSGSHYFKMTTLQGIMDDFIDYDNSVCSFDDGRLEAVLDRLAPIPDEGMADGLKTSIECFRGINRGELRLVQYFPKSLNSFVAMKRYIGSDITAVGYPSYEKKLYARNTVGAYFAITEASDSKEAAFGLLVDILAAFEEQNFNDGNYAFFRSDVYRQLEKYSGKTMFLGDRGLRSVDDSELTPAMTGGFKLTAGDAEEYIAFLDSIDAILSTDSAIYSVYSDECFSSVPRSSKERAEMIQSQASIILSENDRRK